MLNSTVFPVCVPYFAYGAQSTAADAGAVAVISVATSETAATLTVASKFFLLIDIFIPLLRLYEGSRNYPRVSGAILGLLHLVRKTDERESRSDIVTVR